MITGSIFTCISSAVDGADSINFWKNIVFTCCLYLLEFVHFVIPIGIIKWFNLLEIELS